MKPTLRPRENTLHWEQVKKGLPKFAFSSKRDEIRKRVKALNAVIVVLDDDPTGTQTVQAIPVYLSWTTDLLKREMRLGNGLFFLLTNSRALPEKEAVSLAYKTGNMLREAASATGKRLLLVSRSDSTLRGHYPAEVNALADGFGIRDAKHIMVPFFAEGRRLTYKDMHYVLENEMLVPTAKTHFAQDATFGYKNSYLPEWIAEKCGGAIDHSKIGSISLEDSRSGDTDRVTMQLIGSGKRCCIVNAIEERDLETPVLASLKAIEAGNAVIYRSASSLIPVLAGMEPSDLLSVEDLQNQNGSGGLVIIGSHVPKTTTQMEHALSVIEAVSVELEVQRILDGEDPEAIAGQLAERTHAGLIKDKTVFLYTSRNLIRTTDREESLRLSMRVSDTLVKTVQELQVEPRFLIAKGGITSCEIARKALKTGQAAVLGQILPGIPAWQLGSESRFPGLKYIVFPGNVGNEDSLAKAIQKLS